MLRGRAVFLWLMNICAVVPLVLAASQTCEVGPGGPQLYGYKVVAEFPHDPRAFTQGLQYDAVCNSKGVCTDVFWESTGMSPCPALGQHSGSTAQRALPRPTRTAAAAAVGCG
jgi:glutamine cyclotransferase